MPQNSRNVLQVVIETLLKKPRFLAEGRNDSVDGIGNFLRAVLHEPFNDDLRGWHVFTCMKRVVPVILNRNYELLSQRSEFIACAKESLGLRNLLLTFEKCKISVRAWRSFMENPGTFPSIAVEAGGYEIDLVIRSALRFRIDVVNLQYDIRRAATTILTCKRVPLEDLKSESLG